MKEETEQSNIELTLIELAAYFNNNRQVGHTYTMLEGANNVDNCIIISHNNRYSDVLQSKNSCNVTLGSILHNSLRGHNQPLVFDNAALQMIFTDTLIRFQDLYDRLYTCRSNNKRLSDKNARILFNKSQIEIDLRNQVGNQAKTIQELRDRVDQLEKESVENKSIEMYGYISIEYCESNK